MLRPPFAVTSDGQTVRPVRALCKPGVAELQGLGPAVQLLHPVEEPPGGVAVQMVQLVPQAFFPGAAGLDLMGGEQAVEPVFAGYPLRFPGGRIIMEQDILSRRTFYVAGIQKVCV